MSDGTKTLYERLGGVQRDRSWRVICCPGLQVANRTSPNIARCGLA